jgi:hypothetical protein
MSFDSPSRKGGSTMVRTRILVILSSFFLIHCGQEGLTTRSGADLTGPTAIPAPAAKEQGWIISPSDGEVRTHCVPFSGDSESALSTLQASGEIVEVLKNPDFGDAVCKIGDTGRPTSSCFGTVSDPSWLYFVWNREFGRWDGGTVAVNLFQVHDSDLLAFMYTTSTFDPVTFAIIPDRQLPAITFDEACGRD